MSSGPCFSIEYVRKMIRGRFVVLTIPVSLLIFCDDTQETRETLIKRVTKKNPYRMLNLHGSGKSKKDNIVVK